jgi:hypothetical protein
MGDDTWAEAAKGRGRAVHAPDNVLHASPTGGDAQGERVR